MSEQPKTTRRLVLGTVAGMGSLLAGCAGTSSQPTETSTASPTSTPTETATETPTETASPTPEPTTVENFAYPAGASKTGIEPATLYSTHRSAIIDAESVTIDIEQSRDQGDYESSVVQTHAYSQAGIEKTTKESGLTETLWSPAGEEAGFVQLDTGFEQRYRIDNETPRPERYLRLQVAESLLAGGEWSEAKTVTEASDEEVAVVYEAVGIASEQDLSRVVFGDVTEFDAAIAVTEAGYLDELSYDITVERRERTIQQQATLQLGAIGATTVSPPDWESTARDTGVRFSAGVTDDEKAVELELVNGTEIPSGSRIDFSSERFGTTTLGQPVAVDDKIYLGFAEDGDVLLEINEMPDGATDLGRYAYVAIYDEQFPLFEQDIDF